MPKLSIIIPAYNVGSYIGNGIRSCLNQTEPDIEVIIVDDGSTDNTYAVAESFAKTDNRITLIHQKNQGVSAARNAALEVAEGDYVIFLDSDDWLDEDTVKLLLDEAEDEKTLVCCGCYYTDILQDGSYHSESQVENASKQVCSSEDVLAMFGRQSLFRLNSSCFKLFNRQIIIEKGLRFETGIHQGEDGLFTFLYLNQISFVKYIPKPLWYILSRPGSACNSPYSAKWKSAISAIDQMLAYPGISNRIKRNLMAFKAERAMWIEINCLRSENCNKDDVVFAKNILRENQRAFLGKKRSIKSRLQYYVLRFLPYRVLVPLLNVTERRKK